MGRTCILNWGVWYKLKHKLDGYTLHITIYYLNDFIRYFFHYLQNWIYSVWTFKMFALRTKN